MPVTENSADASVSHTVSHYEYSWHPRNFVGGVRGKDWRRRLKVAANSRFKLFPTLALGSLGSIHLHAGHGLRIGSGKTPNEKDRAC
jgi:hypothetical protein